MMVCTLSSYAETIFFSLLVGVVFGAVLAAKVNAFVQRRKKV